MLPSISLLGALLAFTSALVWGSGDFTGGLATRRTNQFQVLLLSALSGLALLVIAALIRQESFPSWSGVMWSALAGIAGTIGIASLYKALSIGESAVVAPTSAVLCAVLPVIYSVITEGLPKTTRIIGFVVAFIGIWIVSQTSAQKTGNSRKGFLLACLAGMGFAGFMVLISQVEAGLVFTPLIIERIMIVIGAILLLRLNHTSFPSIKGNPLSLLAGVLDAGGNIFFLFAKQYTRLDTAVVISSLYPAATVILTGILLKEKISLKQWVGVVICLVAIVLITI